MWQVSVSTPGTRMYLLPDSVPERRLSACRPRVLTGTSPRSGRLTGPREGGARGLSSAESKSPEQHAAWEPAAVKPFEQNLLLKTVRKIL